MAAAGSSARGSKRERTWSWTCSILLPRIIAATGDCADSAASVEKVVGICTQQAPSPQMADLRSFSVRPWLESTAKQPIWVPQQALDRVSNIFLFVKNSWVPWCFRPILNPVLFMDYSSGNKLQYLWFFGLSAIQC
jgi:hypothetical protein